MGAKRWYNSIVIILLEGPDGTGKTTLAHDLAEKHGLEYLHFDIPDKPPLDYWFETLINVNKPMVIDRLHLSEDAYGPVFRDGSALTDNDRWVMEGWLWARKCGLVMCLTTWENMAANQLLVKGKYHGENQKLVVKNYEELIQQTTLPMVIYDYTVYDGFVPSQNHVFSMGLTGFVSDGKRSFIDDINDSEGTVDWIDPGLGTLRPITWLVGDQPNPNGTQLPASPQVVFHNCVSGTYLQEIIGKLGWTWNTFHLSNARDLEGKPYDLQTKFMNLDCPVVVALGFEAADELTRQGIPHGRVSHPQYWKRFHYYEPQEYVDAIREAAGERPHGRLVSPSGSSGS